MKQLTSILAFIVVFILSCNDDSTQPTTASTAADTVKPAENKIMVPNQVCYANTSGKDSIFLKTEIFPNVVTGMLSYKIYEKDSNKGEIDGVMHGDTLIADYKFMSEGITSTRQVVFLIKDSTATEGYGTMEEKAGKMVFKNLHEVDFNKSIPLQKVDCVQ